MREVHWRHHFEGEPRPTIACGISYADGCYYSRDPRKVTCVECKVVIQDLAEAVEAEAGWDPTA